MSKSFFYTKSEPITVNIFQMHCEDQVYYLMDFLSTMPYSEERPLRFYYKVHQKIPVNFFFFFFFFFFPFFLF